MWKKQDDAVGAESDFASKQKPDLSSLGDALVDSLMDDQFKRGNFAVVPQKGPAEDHNPLSPSPTMKTYTEAVNQFTKNATAFIEQLPLLTKARDAYEEAMRASVEMRKVLDDGEENLRTLMTQLEQGVNVRGVMPAPDKKESEPARIPRMSGTDGGAGRATRWP
jgi:hypothetical protein